MSLNLKAMEAMASLATFLSRIHPLSDECKAYITQIASEEFYVKNQVILSAGQMSDRLWFIQKGFAMQYSYKKIAKKPYRFWQEEEIMLNIFSFFKRNPSECYIETVEDCSLLAITYDQVQYLLHQFHETEALIRCILDDYHKHARKAAMNLFVLSAEERYQDLLKTSPHFFQKASTENIAAYLRVSKKALNRMRANIQPSANKDNMTSV